MTYAAGLDAEAVVLGCGKDSVTPKLWCDNTQPMASVLQTPSPDSIRRIQRVQTVTIAWMSVEAAVSLFAAWRASSPAMLAFGGDSAVELFSAVVVLWRFRASDAHEDAEKRAARVGGGLLFALAAYVAITSVTWRRG